MLENFVTFRRIALALVLLTSASGCRGPKGRGAGAEPVATISRDARVLGRMLSLPAAPLDVAFEETPRGIPGGLGPTDYLLVAVLRFEPGVVQRLGRTGAADAGALTATTVPNRAWFPPALKAKLSPASGDSAVVDGRELDAAPLLRPRYTMGSAVAVEGTDYVILTGSTS